MSRPTDDTSADSGEEGQEQPNRSRRYRLEADESTSGKKILVVDDSAMIRLTVC